MFKCLQPTDHRAHWLTCFGAQEGQNWARLHKTGEQVQCTHSDAWLLVLLETVSQNTTQNDHMQPAQFRYSLVFMNFIFFYVRSRHTDTTHAHSHTHMPTHTHTHRHKTHVKTHLYLTTLVIQSNLLNIRRPRISEAPWASSVSWLLSLFFS